MREGAQGASLWGQQLGKNPATMQEGQDAKHGLTIIPCLINTAVKNITAAKNMEPHRVL